MKISPRISTQAAEWLGRTFSSKTAGAEYCLEAFHSLYRATISRELRGVFTQQELYAMVDVINSAGLSPSLAGQHLLADIEDAITLDGLAGKWGFDGPGLVPRLRALIPWQLACLEIWAKAFWVCHLETPGGADLDKWVNVLVRGKVDGKV